MHFICECSAAPSVSLRSTAPSNRRSLRTIRTKAGLPFANITFRRGGAFSGAEGAAHQVEAENKPRDMTVPTDKCESTATSKTKKCRRQRKAQTELFFLCRCRFLRTLFMQMPVSSTRSCRNLPQAGKSSVCTNCKFDADADFFDPKL